LLDLKVVNAALVPGDGSEPAPGEVGVRDGRIARVAAQIAEDARTVVDAQGHALAPGFIDLHTHVHTGPLVNFLRQGVTLAVGGNCGHSPLDLAQAARELERTPTGPNIALLVGHGSVREAVLGWADRAPGAAELDRMQGMVCRAMESGAMGLSTGLVYAPASYAKTDEVIALAAVAAQAGGFYATHMRDEWDHSLEAIGEALHIGATAGLPVHISHHKAKGRNNWGLSERTLARLDAARQQGRDVTHDAYPYTASQASIFLLLPGPVCEGGTEAIRARLADREARAQARSRLIAALEGRYRDDLSDVVVATCAHDSGVEARTIAEVTHARGRGGGLADAAETVLELVAADPRPEATYCVYHSMSEQDVRRILGHPYTAVASDGEKVPFGKGRPHPRHYGTFPRVLGLYCREESLFSLGEAVRRMTGLPARRLGLTDRGRLAEGAWADLVLFDPQTVRDRATFEDPHQYAQGFDLVVVNGTVVVREDRPTGALCGQFVPRPG